MRPTRNPRRFGGFFRMTSCAPAVFLCPGMIAIEAWIADIAPEKKNTQD